VTKNCKELWAAVLEQAIEDFNRGYFYADRARAWFQSESEEVGSFLWICRMLSVDAERTKEILRERHPDILVRDVEGDRSGKDSA
jgi:hypothetical protein